MPCRRSSGERMERGVSGHVGLANLTSYDTNDAAIGHGMAFLRGECDGERMHAYPAFCLVSEFATRKAV